MKDSNLALYRKYRPSSFDEILGQDHIVKAISGALEAGKVSHAYLLCGPRGTGKTSVARIIANVLGSSANDIYEMDAASNRGIDDIRNIKESVETMPFDSKYKIYISGDTGYFFGFKKFKEKFGKIDYAFLPVGPSDPRWLMHYQDINLDEALESGRAHV